MTEAGPWRRLSAGLVLLLSLACCQPGTQSQQAADGQNGPSSDGAGPNGTNTLNIADAAIAGDEPAMALKISQSILASDPTNTQALYEEAAAYYAMGRCEDAIAADNVALGIDPKSSKAETGIGRCLLKTDATAAEKAFNAAVQDDPGNAAAQNDLGIARDLQGNYAGANGPYHQALLLEPGTLSTEVNLGLSLALAGDSSDALLYLGPLAGAADATPRIREDYAVALLAAGRTQEARQVLAIDLSPDQANELITDISPVLTPAQAPASPAPAATDATPEPVPVSPTVAVDPVSAATLPAPAAPAPSAPPPAAGPVGVTSPAPAAAAPAPATIAPPAMPAAPSQPNAAVNNLLLR